MGYRDREGRCWVATGRRYFDYLRLREADSELVTYVHKRELSSWPLIDADDQRNQVNKQRRDSLVK